MPIFVKPLSNYINNYSVKLTKSFNLIYIKILLAIINIYLYFSLSNILSDNSDSNQIDMIPLLENDTLGFCIKNLYYLIMKKLFPYATLFFTITSYLTANVLYNLTLKQSYSYFSISNMTLK